MNKLKLLLLYIATLTVLGCSGEIKYDNRGIDVKVKEQDSQKVINLEQNVLLTAQTKRKIYRENLYTYTPCQIIFTDFQNLPELPRPLPFSLFGQAEPSISPSGKFIIRNYPEEAPYPPKDFAIPFEIQGKKRVSKETLDFLIASGQVEPLEEYSLGTIVVNYDTRQSVHVKNIVYKSYLDITFYDKDGLFTNYFASAGTYNKYETDSNGDFKIFKGILNRLDDPAIKNITDEIIWQIVTVESIEGLFEKIRAYEENNIVPITHFAVNLEKKYGLEGTFNSGSNAKGGFLIAESSSNAQTDSRYSIHLSGITATSLK